MMQEEQDKNMLQPDENIQKNANALGNAIIDNNNPDSITREERTKQYKEGENEFNKLDDRGVKPGDARQDV